MSDSAAVNYIVENGLDTIIKKLYSQVQNSPEEKDARDAAIKLHDILTKNGLLNRTQIDIQPIKFKPQHFADVVTGLTHLARYSGLEGRMEKEQIADALSWLTNPESVR